MGNQSPESTHLSSDSTDQSSESIDYMWESCDQSSESSDEYCSYSSDQSSESSDEYCSYSSDQSSETSDDSWESNDEAYDHHEYHSCPFEQPYRCYPMSGSIQNGDRVILPESALDRLSRMVIQYPMSFELRNPKTQKLTHCGVLEFSSEEGLVLLPNWMMEKMGFEPGDMAMIKNLNLAKGMYVKLQPHTSDFLQISNPKSVLETTLRRYSCLTAGDTIMIMYGVKKFYIDVLETKPPSSSSAISIIDTDCEVDLAPPLDYKKPEKPAEISDKIKPVAEEEVGFRAFTGVGRRLDGNHVTNHSTDSATKLGTKIVFRRLETVAESRKQSGKSRAKGEAEKKEEKGFQAFTGKSCRLMD
ncbi:hypothetical protein FNV43_RR13287 [Rhamnella rubrinervis]|uniref:Ubiquitin fusion degradaton protein n=1 Tax=Rhamnella rubrinervis TaxID=2594499 RepID=A0A8K0MDY8_9ROSA|nr:hypothetical protein FNV43_RR13287 [Rhamnella rubrinervis]